MRQAIIIIAVLLLLTACASSKKTTQKEIPTVTMQETTETRVIHTERIDTVFVEIPAQSAERTTQERKSHLETDYAESDAQINLDGTLSHYIRNKAQPTPVPIKTTTDTIYIDKAIEKPVPIYVPKPVEKELTWWEKIRLKTWGWILTALLITAAWIWGKPIVTFVRRLITKQP